MIYYEFVSAKSDPDEGIRCTIEQNMMPGKVYMLHTYFKLFDKNGHAVYKKMN